MPSSSLLRLTLFFFFSLIPSSFSKTHPTDIAVLKSLLHSILPSSIPSSSCLSSWHFSPHSDPCDSLFSSSHFTCALRCDFTDPTTNLSRVTDIALDPAAYSASLPAAIWSLSHLQSLDLSDNNFHHQFPSPPPNITTNLRRLAVSSNSFSGPLPDLSSAGISLEEAYLDNNFFTGGLDSLNLTKLSCLERLELQANNLTGPLPDLNRLDRLSYFDASDNYLTGEFLSANQFPPSLLEVSLRNNRLSGSLPGSVFSTLPGLQVLDLSGNGLSGPVPRELFAHPGLEQLTLSKNGFVWIEDPSRGGWMSSQLVALDLSHNDLRGLLPGFIGAMPRLSAVDLGDNKFTGMIPVEYAMRAVGADGTVRFERLILSGNYLFGPIPGPMDAMKEGTAKMVSLKDNCLFRCPEVFFFCEDGRQKPSATCREFSPMIP